MKRIGAMFAVTVLIAGVILGVGSVSSRLIVSAQPVSLHGPEASSSGPVFVELFTSEGCSSCPPADALLAQIAQQQPNAIVLSEHVTYWNHLGWRDPFSSQESTDRQSAYVASMGLESSYTPQMVVNGQYEFVGNDGHAAAQALRRAATAEQVPVTISNLTLSADHHVHFDVEAGEAKTEASLFAVLAQDEGSEHVANGENGGKTLRHVQIARRFQRIASVRKGSPFHGSQSMDLPEAIAGSGWHLVVFLQQEPGRPILGATSQPIHL
jgi:hypothetical protein